MLFSDKSRKTVKACRFCWMCRHLCPVGFATGKESNGPRAKALFIHLNEKGVDIEAEMAQDMYECVLCNACAYNCETGYEPPVYIREARANLIANGLVPTKVQTVIDCLFENGNLYGVKADDALKSLSVDTEADVLIYIGATAAVKAQANVNALKSLLSKAGVAFKVFCGAEGSGSHEYDLLGDVQEVHDMCVACAGALNAESAKKIIVLNPSDAVMFKQQYPAWGIKINAEVITATAFVAELVKSGVLELEKDEGVVTYHDPCRLARDLEETEPTRELIVAMGYELKDMVQSRKITKCCGGEVLKTHAPEIVAKMADNRVKDAASIGAKCLVTACPGCTANLSATKTIDVKDIFVLLDELTG